MDRREVELTLSRDRAWLLEKIAEMPAADIERGATQSAHDTESQWSAKDHVVHLIGIERAFNGMIRQHVGGDPEPLKLMSNADGAPRTLEQIMKVVNETNEQWVVEHRGKSLSEVIALGQRTRAETLELLAGLTDEQLLQKVPKAPWSDGTVGGILSTNGVHAHMHWKQVREGLA